MEKSSYIIYKGPDLIILGSAQCNHKSPLRGRQKGLNQRRRCDHRSRGQNEAGPLAKEEGWRLEAGTGKNVDSSLQPWNKHSPAKPVQTFDLHNCKRTDLCHYVVLSD